MADNKEQQPNTGRNFSKDQPDSFIIRRPSGAKVKTESGAMCFINKSVVITMGRAPTDYSFITPLLEKSVARLSVIVENGDHINHLESGNLSFQTSDGVIDSTTSWLGNSAKSLLGDKAPSWLDMNNRAERKALLEQAGITCDKDGVITAKDLKDLAGASDPVVKPPLPSASAPTAASLKKDKGQSLV